MRWIVDMFNTSLDQCWSLVLFWWCINLHPSQVICCLFLAFSPCKHETSKRSRSKVSKRPSCTVRNLHLFIWICFSHLGPMVDSVVFALIMLWVSVWQMCGSEGPAVIQLGFVIAGDEQIRRHDGLPGTRMCRISTSRGHWSKLHDFFTCLVRGRIGASGRQWFGTTYDDPLAFGIRKDSWQSSNWMGMERCCVTQNPVIN